MHVHTQVYIYIIPIYIPIFHFTVSGRLINILEVPICHSEGAMLLCFKIVSQALLESPDQI